MRVQRWVVYIERAGYPLFLTPDVLRVDMSAEGVGNLALWLSLDKKCAVAYGQEDDPVLTLIRPLNLVPPKPELIMENPK
jgi:hypothetical protein